MKCVACDCKFDIDEARDEYNSYFDDDCIDYDEDYPDHNLCGDCAIAETESNINTGKAIDMVNGEDDYDQDFVDKWL